MPSITLSDREFHTALAALRYWQDSDPGFVTTLNPGLVDVLTNGGAVEPLSRDEIDSLCERINTEPAPSGALAKLLAEAVAYQAEQFDGPPDTDLNVSGTDLVDWFTDWRQRLRTAVAAPEVEYSAGAGLGPVLPRPLTADELVEAVQHARPNEFARAVLAGNAKRPTLAVILEGGMVQDIVSDAPEVANAALEGIIIVDYDTEGSEGNDVALIRQTDGSYSDAFVHDEGISPAEIDLAQVDADDRARDAALEAGWSYDRFHETFKHANGKRTANEDVSCWVDLCRAEAIEF